MKNYARQIVSRIRPFATFTTYLQPNQLNTDMANQKESRPQDKPSPSRNFLKKIRQKF
jgi:hypothetical protein